MKGIKKRTERTKKEERERKETTKRRKENKRKQWKRVACDETIEEDKEIKVKNKRK